VKLEYFDYQKAGTVQLRWQPPEEKSMAEGKWPVYLPKGADWYNFWTGEKHTGGQTVLTDAPLDTLPLYVKAGSIVPMGPVQEWVDQKPADKLDIHVYPGADGRFILYEDEGDNYNYENGTCTRIPFEWDDENGTLVIGDRQGRYPGMLQERTFNVILPGGRIVQIIYNGERQAIKL
jgi:alpha-D-xyloside xylohydrolase